MDYAALRDEIESGPLAGELAPLVAAGRDADVAGVLNRRDIAGRRLLELWEVKLHCIQGGCWPKIRAAAAISPSNADEQQLQAVAQTVLDYVNDQRFQTIDIDDAASQTMLGVLVLGGALTSEESAGISALADTLVSRADQVFGPGVVLTNSDIAAALRGE